MVQLKELRIVLPYKPEDYERGAIYTGARASYEASKEAEGTDAIELVKVEEYFDEELQKMGTYTRRVYHVENYLPGWIAALLPKSALTFYEDSYDCFPKVDTRVTNGSSDRPEQLKIRKVEIVDINKYKSKDLDPKMHPSNVELKDFEPSHLEEGWMDKAETLMCAYKLVTCKIQVWGLQGKIEGWMMNFEEDLLTRVHVNIFAWTDEWMKMTRKEVDEYVLKCKEDLKELYLLKSSEKDKAKESKKDKTKDDKNGEKVEKNSKK